MCSPPCRDEETHHFEPRMIRVQAMNTLDLFVERVKTLTADYPETVLPPTQATDGTAGTNIPRIGTPQTDESWAGWAISSFTKNLSKAVGELESKNTATPNGSSNRGAGSLPGSKLTIPASPMARSTSPSPSSNLRKSSTAPVGESKSTPAVFGNSDNEDNDPDAWGDLEEDTFFDAPTETSPQNPTGSMKIHEDDELDFASLVQPRKKELPKGLSKHATASNSTARSSITTSPKAPSRTTSTGMKPIIGGTVASAKRSASVVATTARKPTITAVAAKKQEKLGTTKVAEKDPWGDGDGWGDGW